MAIPNCQSIVADLAGQFPDEWRAAHTGGRDTEAFIRRLAHVLHTTVDARFGLNGKRGNPNDISDDALNFKGEGPGNDPTDGNRPVTVIDVIAAAGGPDARPSWQVFSDLPGPGAWVKPEPVGSGSAGGGSPSPTPPPPTAPDLRPILDAIKALDNKVGTLGDIVMRLQQSANTAAYEALNAASRASEIKTQIENLPKPSAATAFPAYGGRIFGAKVRFEPEPK